MSGEIVDSRESYKPNRTCLERFCITLFGVVINLVVVLMVVSLALLTGSFEIPLLQSKFVISAQTISTIGVTILLFTPVAISVGAILISVAKRDFKIALSALLLLAIITSGVATTLFF